MAFSMWKYGAALAALGCVSVTSAQTTDGFRIATARISIQYNSQMQRQIQWLEPASRNVLAFDPAAQEGVVIGGVEIVAFPLDAARSSQRRINDPEFGPALEGTLAGVAEPGSGTRVERVTRVLLPDRMPDSVLFRTTYTNRSDQAKHFDKVYSQRVVLDRKLADPRQPSYDFTSYQGGSYRWGEDYCLIKLIPGFQRSNFQGVDDIRGPEGNGGGMPFVDVWGPTMGVALAQVEALPQWLSLPVEVRADQKVEAAVTEAPLAKFGQKEWLKPGESFQTVTTAVILHRLDYYDALKTYGQLLRARGVKIPETSPEYAYEPYWKSWGFARNFTVEKILALLPELRSMGIRTANLDDGWFNLMGDWDINRSPGKFPNGEADMIAFVKKMHAEGFKTAIWWYPLGADPKSKFAQEHKDLFIQNESGGYPLDERRTYQLCPAYGPAVEQIRRLVTQFVGKWDFDGIYLDSQGLGSIPPCFNKAHNHRSPLDSFQAIPKVFEEIYTTQRQIKKDPFSEVCICSMPHSPYNMPFYDIASASDPVNLLQVRSRIKAEKAIRGGSFAVGDCYQVPIEEWEGFSVPESFESAMGTGAQLTTFYAQLDDRARELWTRWFKEYGELRLSRAEYLNLYDIAYDKPEVHVVRKGKELYYGIFADVWPRNRAIPLRGLDQNTTYELYDYGNRRSLGTVQGARPSLRVGFKDSLLVRARPLP